MLSIPLYINLTKTRIPSKGKTFSNITHHYQHILIILYPLTRLLIRINQIIIQINILNLWRHVHHMQNTVWNIIIYKILIFKNNLLSSSRPCRSNKSTWLSSTFMLTRQQRREALQPQRASGVWVWGLVFIMWWWLRKAGLEWIG